MPPPAVTQNLQLAKFPTGYVGWGDYVNENFDILDGQIAQLFNYFKSRDIPETVPAVDHVNFELLIGPNKRIFLTTTVSSSSVLNMVDGSEFSILLFTDGVHEFYFPSNFRNATHVTQANGFNRDGDVIYQRWKFDSTINEFYPITPMMVS